jgi:outer membrane protein OmpA-like peptidoglycan-associated protein
MKLNAKWMMVGAVLTVGAMLQGCSTTTSHPDMNGQSSNIVFPKADSAWPKEGTFPNLESLRLVKPGMTKDQLYHLLGRPHFNEGIAGVREWDYLFKFRTGRGDEVQTCQYKVLYDKNMVSRSYFWMPESCAEFVKQPAAPVAQAPAAAVTLVNSTLGADGLFSFDGWRLEQLQPEGREKLQSLAAQLRGMKQVSRVEVNAYTDRIGSAAYNQDLSMKRAETVRSYLASQGIDSRIVVAKGNGAADPMVQCGSMSKEALAKCLAPNRRVQVSAFGQG